jgi:predicted GIY-YIG superfamily endonuclease
MLVSKPRSVNIFLLDGTPEGIREAQIAMSTIRALAFPQSLFGRIKKEFSEHISRPGVYILIGNDESKPDQTRAYIGESEDVCERLSRHLNDKTDKAKTTWWANTIIFTVKDDNLTKAHIRYVEARLIALGRKKVKWALGNGNNPPDAGKLPLADRHAMDEFTDQVKTLVGTLGYDLFRADSSGSLQSDLIQQRQTGPAEQAEFAMSGTGYGAKMIPSNTTGKFVVLKGSTCRKKENPSLPAGARKLRQQLRDDGVIEPHMDGLLFVEDYGFSSTSAAATVISGNPSAGPTTWKTNAGITYKDWIGSRENAPSDGA